MNGYKREGSTVHIYGGRGPLPEGFTEYQPTIVGSEVGVLNCSLPRPAEAEQTRSAIIELAWKKCGIQGDAIRQLATVLTQEGYRKFEIVEEDV